MPTFEWQALFDREWRSLTAEQQRAFRDAVAAFVEDLREGTGFRKGLRVKSPHCSFHRERQPGCRHPSSQVAPMAEFLEYYKASAFCAGAGSAT